MFEYLCFSEHSWPTQDDELRLDYSEGKLYFKLTKGFAFHEMEGTYKGNPEEFVKKLEDLHIENWEKEYFEPILDGYGWNLSYKEVGKRTKHIVGYNGYPENYDSFHALVFSILCEEMRGKTNVIKT